MKKIFFALAAAWLSWSCSNIINEQSSYVNIGLSKNISKTTSKLILNDYLEDIKIIPLETSKEFLLSNFRFVAAKGDDLILNDKENVYFIDKSSGKLLSRISRKGNGRGEYIQIFNVELLNDGTILILDPSKRRLSNYTPNGDFISAIKNDSFGLVKQLDNGAYIVNYSPHVKSTNSIGIYDKDWNLIRESIPNDTETEFRMLYYDALDCYNGENLFRQSPLGDTIYRITYEKNEPYIVINKGNYKAPANIYSDLNKLNTESSKYITQDYAILVRDLLFLRYTYNKSYYSDVWNIENNNLTYRGVIDINGGVYGIPLLIEGSEIDVWPSYAEGNRLYVTVEACDATKFMPNISESDNPVILELTLKK